MLTTEHKIGAPAVGAARVLTVLPDFPFPPTTGLHLRIASNLGLVRRLGCFSAALYFSTERREVHPDRETTLANLCHEVTHGGRRIPHCEVSVGTLLWHKADFLIRGAMGLRGTCYPFSMSYDRMGAAERILTEARRIKAEFVILPSMFLHYTTKLRGQGFSVVIDASDVLTNLSASFLRGAQSGRGGRLGLFANYLACRSQERIFLKECIELWATSAAEVEAFRGITPGVHAIVVPNSLDEEVVRPGAPVTNPIVGFIGTYSYSPNLEAASFLAERVFPLMLRTRPDAVLRLAGADLPERTAAKLRGLQNVEVLGPVADSGEFMNECSVVALPIFLRGGVPLKLVEAMARGKAIVASPELLEGLGLEDQKELLIRRKPEEFAAAITALLDDASLRERLGANARAHFVQHFSVCSAEAVLRRESVLVYPLRTPAGQGVQHAT